jgi:hypothetical protein
LLRAVIISIAEPAIKIGENQSSLTGTDRPDGTSGPADKSDSVIGYERLGARLKAPHQPKHRMRSEARSMSQKVCPDKSLSELFLERVIRIEPVQRERAQLAKQGKAAAGEENDIAGLRAVAFEGRGKVIKDYAEHFFELGFVPGRALSPLWPLGGAPTPFSQEGSGFQMSPAMERAWQAALEQWLLLCRDLREGKLITIGIDSFGDGERKEIDPAAYLKDGLWFKVWENAIYTTNHHDRFVKSMAAITVRKADRESEVKADQPNRKGSVQESTRQPGAEADRPDSVQEVASKSPVFEENPPPKFGRILWPRLLADQVAIRNRGGLPDPEEYLDYAKARIEDFFGTKVPEFNESNLRRFKKALYDGESELPWDKRARKSDPD